MEEIDGELEEKDDKMEEIDCKLGQMNHTMRRKNYKMGQMDALKDVFSKMDNIIFVLTVFAVELMRQSTRPFLFVLMKDEMQASHTAMGLASFISTMSEFIVFQLSNKLIQMIGGPLQLMQIGLLSLLLRILLTSYINNTWLNLLPQLIDGASFALFMSSSIEYTKMISHEEIHVTMYTILASLGGLSAAIGGMLGGYLYSKCGGPILYRLTAVFGTVWSVILFYYFQLLPILRDKMNSSQY